MDDDERLERLRLIRKLMRRRRRRNDDLDLFDAELER
jgi:hypothetical protein